MIVVWECRCGDICVLANFTVFSADDHVTPRPDPVLFSSLSGQATLDGATRAVEGRPTLR